MRGLVSFICALSLSLSGVVSVAAQTQQRFALAGTTWEISYQDARLGVVQGLAKFGDGQAVSGFYQDPRDGSEHPFTGVARLEMLDGVPVATISIIQEGPWIGPSPGDLSVKPGGRIAAKLGKSKASLTVLETSPVTLSLELDEGSTVFEGLWTSENMLTKPMRAGALNLSEGGKRQTAGLERWVPSFARFAGKAEINDVNRNVSDGKKAAEQKFKIELRGIGLPDYEAVTQSTVDFKGLADTLSLDFVWPTDGDFGRSLEMRVNAKEIPGPGTYPMTLNGVSGTWTLAFNGLEPKVRLVRQLREKEFEAVSQIYIGEDVFVEVDFEQGYKVAALDFATYDTVVLDSTDTRHDVTVRKVGSSLYRSSALACLVEDKETARQAASKITCIDDAQLSAIVEGAQDYQHGVTHSVVKAPSPLWDKGMAAAETCRTASFDQNVKGVNVQKQVHAALILLRDEMKRSIAGTVETYNTLIGPDPDLRMDKLASDLEIYKASIKSGEIDGALIQQVSLPNASKSDEKISLRDALNGNYEPPLSDEARQDYERIAASEAQGMMLSAAERTKKRLDAVGDCDLEALLQFGQLGAGAFNEKLKKKLLRRGLPGEADWMPDLAARAAVDSVAGIVGAVKAEEAFRQAAVDYALTIVSLSTAVVAIGATVSTKLAAAGTRVAGRAIGKEYSAATLARLAAAGELAELAELGSAFTKVVDAQTRGQEAVDRARDLAPIIGGDAFEQAQAEKDAQIKGAAFAAAASGAGAVGAGVLGRLGKTVPSKTPTPGTGTTALRAPPPGATPQPTPAAPATLADGSAQQSTRVLPPRPLDTSTPTRQQTQVLPKQSQTTQVFEPRQQTQQLPQAAETTIMAGPGATGTPSPATTQVMQPQPNAGQTTQIQTAGTPTTIFEEPEFGPVVPTSKLQAPSTRMDVGQQATVIQQGQTTVRQGPPNGAAVESIGTEPTLLQNNNGQNNTVGDGFNTSNRPTIQPGDPSNPFDGASNANAAPAAAIPANNVPSDTLVSKAPPPPPAQQYRDTGGPLTVDQLDYDPASPFKRDYSRNLEINKDPRGMLDGPDVKVDLRGKTRVIPGDKIVEYDPITRQRQVVANLGEPLGGGAASTVFRDAADPARVRRLTEVSPEKITNVEDDIIGRRILRDAQSADGYFRVSRQDAEATRLIKDPYDPNRSFLLTREENLAVKINGRTVTNAGERFADGMPPPNPKQLATMTLAVREMNAKGLVWSDHKLANFDIVPDDLSATGYKMVIFDTGGVRPVTGIDATTMAANARRLQKVYDNTPRERLGRYLSGANGKLIGLVDNRPFGGKVPPISLTPNNVSRTRYLDLDNMSDQDLTVQIGTSVGAPLRLPGAQ